MNNLQSVAGIVTLCSFAFLSSCVSDREELPQVEICDTMTVSFATHVQPLITTNCAIQFCHEAGFANGDFTTYAGLKSKVDNGTFKVQVLDNKTMPVGLPLSSGELDVLGCWYNGGALDN